MIAVFIIQIGVSFAKSLRFSKDYFIFIYTSYGVLYVNFIIFIIEFLYFGSAVYKCML